MKFILLFLLSIASFSAVAFDATALLTEKEKIRKDLSSMSCAEFNKGLPELAENVDALKDVKQGSFQFELSLYGIKKSLEKANECLSGKR